MLTNEDQKKSLRNFVQQFCHFYLNVKSFDSGQFIISYNELNEIYKEDKTRQIWFKVTVSLLIPVFVAGVIMMSVLGPIPGLVAFAIAFTLIASICYQMNQIEKGFDNKRRELGSFINDLSFYKQKNLSPEIPFPTQYPPQ